MAIKRYSRKEPLVFLWVMGPYIAFMNLLIFGICIFASVKIFFETFFASAIYFFLIYLVFGTVAVVIKNRISAAGDLFKRIMVMLPVFYIMNIGAVYGAFNVFEKLQMIQCSPIKGMLWWTILYGCVMSTVITFINEGMANWEKWKNSISESEKLKNNYQRSKLLGLKGQINPHFLFNCFNTLSGLIPENEEEAEKFLDEMTKVHRYLLRNDDDFLVPVVDEIKFAQSYLNLIKARFGNAINTSVNLTREALHQFIPPLSLQVILENIIYTNALNKKQPLKIQIDYDSDNALLITHSLHEKIIVQNLNVDEGLDNLLRKYSLLNAEGMQIAESEGMRTIVLPLFRSKEITL